MKKIEIQPRLKNKYLFMLVLLFFSSCTSDLISDSNLNANTAITGVRKFHPGHYISVITGSQANILDAIGSPTHRIGVQGIQKRYDWIDLETSLDVYDFTEIKNDLDLMATEGKHLVVFITDKSFVDHNPLPLYLQSEYSLPLSPTSKSGVGFISKRWDPYVISRFKALFKKLGEEFDKHPAFEGIALQESSLGIDSATLTAHYYTPEKYRDALISILMDAAQSLPTSQVFWYMNFITGHNSYLADVASAVASAGVAMGGPDILPEEAALVRVAYPYYGQFKDKMILFGSMQNDSYAELRAGSTTEYWPMNEMFLFARDNLHVKYIFWNQKKSVGVDVGSNTWLDALPVISNNPTFNP